MRAPISLLTACLSAALAGFPAPPAAAQEHAPPQTLTVATQPGALEDAQRATLFQPFTTSTSIPVSPLDWAPTIPALAQALAGAHPANVLLLPGDVARQACQQNELQKLDFDKLGGKDHFLPQGIQDCAMGSVTTAVALAWDRDKYHGNPPGWAEFWDVARVPGKRGLPHDPRFTLEIALLADGVAPGDVYHTLLTKDGVDRAFRKLDQLRPYVVWWNSAAEAVRILESGDVLLAAAPTGNVAVAAHGGKALSVQWTNALSAVLYWALPGNLPAPTQDSADRFLAYAAATNTQAKLQTAIPYGGLVKGANDNLPPDVADWSTGTQAHQQSMLATDEQFWRDNDEKLTQRFEDWLRK